MDMLIEVSSIYIAIYPTSLFYSLPTVVIRSELWQSSFFSSPQQVDLGYTSFFSSVSDEQAPSMSMALESFTCRGESFLISCTYKHAAAVVEQHARAVGGDNTYVVLVFTTKDPRH